jgi:Flp pilus assembly protein TadG
VSVEVALLLPLLVGVMFAILEMGALMRDLMFMGNAAREGVRRAAVGGQLAEIEDAVATNAPHLASERLEMVAEYRVFSGEEAGSWQALQNAGETNNAGPGSQVRVRLEYEHRLVAGSLYSRLLGNPGATTVDLTVTRFMRRE